MIDGSLRIYAILAWTSWTKFGKSNLYGYSNPKVILGWFISIPKPHNNPVFPKPTELFTGVPVIPLLGCEFALPYVLLLTVSKNLSILVMNGFWAFIIMITVSPNSPFFVQTNHLE